MNLNDLDTPALLVDLDILERNIANMARITSEGGKSLRPHTKTHKTPEIARMQTAAGAHGLTCAKLGEAEVLVGAGFDDIFVANQIVGPLKIDRLMKLAVHARITVAIDSIEGATPIGEAAAERGIRIPVRIEVDTGLGRAGARSETEVLGIARCAADSRGLELTGIFTHEGHLYKSAEPKIAADRVATQMRATAAMVAAAGFPCASISVGSTPGAPLMAGEPGLTELRPGVYVFNDRSQVRLGAPKEACALTVLATVVSVRSDGKVIVDAGTKSLASDCPFEDRTFGEIVGQPELRFVGASEEHGHLLVEGGARLHVGDRVRIIPNHACTCVNMHDTMNAVRGETVEAAWAIAGRGRIR
jgi:D-serine deaminase-like pyridoxal phosphate-dependent protein